MKNQTMSFTTSFASQFQDKVKHNSRKKRFMPFSSTKRNSRPYRVTRHNYDLVFFRAKNRGRRCIRYNKTSLHSVFPATAGHVICNLVLVLLLLCCCELLQLLPSSPHLPKTTRTKGAEGVPTANRWQRRDVWWNQQRTDSHLPLNSDVSRTELICNSTMRSEWRLCPNWHIVTSCPDFCA